MDKIGTKIWHNGALVPWASAKVHVLAHGLHYGSAVFEGIRCYDGVAGSQFLHLRAHLQRLADSARIYRMPLPYDVVALVDACHAVMADSGLSAGYLRPIAYRGLGTLGLMPHDSPVEVAIGVLGWGAYLGEEAAAAGIDVGVASWARMAANTVPTQAKASGNYLSSQLIAMEAHRNGYHEAIALDTHGFVSEGPGENIFLVRAGCLTTPPATAAILPGLTRAAIIQLARACGLEVREEAIAREALHLADELFFTGTAAEVTPIRSVDRLQVGDGRPGPITRALQASFQDIVHGRAVDTWNWLEPLRPTVD